MDPTWVQNGPFGLKLGLNEAGSIPGPFGRPPGPKTVFGTQKFKSKFNFNKNPDLPLKKIATRVCLNSPQFEVFKNEPCGPSSPKNCQNGTRSGSHPNSSSQKAPMHNSLVQITTLKFTFCDFQEKISFTFKTLRSFFKVF